MLVGLGTPFEIRKLAKILRDTPARKPLARFGEIAVASQSKGIAKLQYNRESWELLHGSHDYVLQIGGSKVEISAQLYRNVNDHYRLFSFARSGSFSGLLFSLNFTTEKDAAGMIALSQRLRFSEGRKKKPDAATAVRQAKTVLLADILVRCGIAVTDNYEVDLGLFSSARGEFVNTAPARFMSEFFSIALLKGHIQGNKGYQFASLPRFDDSFPWKSDTSVLVRQALRPNKQGKRGIRAIPVGLRFQVLERDGGRCCLCGRSRTEDITLHVDHVLPYSLGGLTVLSNLQTLCGECNIGKSNRSQIAYV